MPDTSDSKSHAYQGRSVHCARCGQPIADVGSAVIDKGEYNEQGKTFFYCSIECRESH